MNALTKAKLVERLFEQQKLNKRVAKAFVDYFFEHMCSILETGHSIKFSGFGNFYLRDKTERPGRNPKTGEVYSVASRRVVTFRAGHKLKVRVEQSVSASS
ncbi:MAG: integration host factor subunit alpha [Proteobacteria bacterium]|nr:integration host factor subunit alpha [Pseudomonadota bacterium]